MKSISLLALVLAVAAGGAQAQSSATGGPDNQPPVSNPGGRVGKDYIPGWTTLSAKEKKEQRAKLRSFTDYATCRSYVDGLQQSAEERAKTKGGAAPAKPSKDACGWLKK